MKTHFSAAEEKVDYRISDIMAFPLSGPSNYTLAQIKVYKRLCKLMSILFRKSPLHLSTLQKTNMCYGIEVIAWDLLVVVAIIMLIVWILGLVHVYTIPTGGLFHIFIVLAVIFLIAWLFVRCCGCGGRYRRRRGAAGGPIV